MAKMTTEQALRGGKYVLRKKKQQKSKADGDRKSMPRLIEEGSKLAKGGKLSKTGKKFKDNPDDGEMSKKADLYKYA
jgi:hypothetical protein